MSNDKYLGKCQKILPDTDSGDAAVADEEEAETVRKRPNVKAFEIREVELLDPDTKPPEPAPRTSGIAEKLQQKRKLRHDKLMIKLAEDLNEVNVRIEENIRISSEEVKAHIKLYKDRLQDKLKSLDSPQVASYHESVFLDIQKEADSMRSHQLSLVQDLYEDLCKFENQRSAEYERIFHSSFQEIEKTAYILPYDLQKFIEHEALKTNQLMLNNRRCYEDLKLKLVLVTEQTFKSFIDEAFCLKEKWVRYNQQEEMDLKYSRTMDQEQSMVVRPEPQTRLELKRHELVLKLTPDGCFNIVTTDEWFGNVTDVSNALDSAKNTLVDFHQRLIKTVEEDLKSDSYELRSFQSLEVLQFEERSIQPIVFTSGVAGENMEALELYWQGNLRNIKRDLEDSVNLLTNFCDLWNRHTGRLCESKVLVLKAVEKAEEKGTNAVQELEVKLNLSLDALRQEYNEGKLEAFYAAVVANLDAIKERLESDYINEVTVIEDYYKMMNLEADVLSSEIKEFMYLKLLEVPESEDEEKMAPKQDEVGIEFTKNIEVLFLGMKVLKVWKSELRKVLEEFAENTRERLAWRAEDWVNSRAQEISRKYQTQLEMHHKRYDRIRTQIYEVRQQEIYIHQRVFDEHKAGVDEVYRKLTQTTENFYEKSTEKLECCRDRVMSAVAEAKKEDKATSLKCIQTHIQKQKADFMMEVAMKAQQCQQEIEFRVSSVQQSNLKFMKSIRLFHENGNYDADEAKSYITPLENIDKETMSEGKAATRETRKRETEIFQKAAEVFDNAIRTLMQLDDELQFYGYVKNVVNLCKNDFQELSASLKEDFDLLHKHADFMSVCIADETSFLTQEEDGLWFLLIAILYRNISNLFYTLPVPEWLADAVEETKENMQGKKTQVPQTGKVKGARSDYPCKDFRDEVFDQSVLSDGAPAFMNSVCKKIWDSMENLQKTGYAFYKSMGSKSLIRGDILKPNYEEFGSDTCQLFRSFALQCETVWLQMIRGFLPVLGSVKTMLKTYFERRVREYTQNIISALDVFYTEFTNCFNQNICHILRELQSLDNKLLPLHGYPRNSHLLKSLEDEVVAKTAALELAWKVFTKGYENKLKSVRKLITSDNEEYQTLERYYTVFRDAIFADELGKDLLHFLDKTIDERGYVRKSGKTSSKVTDREVLPYVTLTYAADVVKPPQEDKQTAKYQLKLYHLQGGLEDADTYFSDIKQIIRRETANIPLESDMKREDWMILVEPKLGLLTDAEEFEDITASDMKRIKTIYREIKRFLQSKTNFHKEVVLEWLDRWKENTDKNAALYTVRYPDAEEPSDQSSETSKDKGKFRQQ